MDRVIVIGAGWAGCAAALQAAKGGADVVLLERTDMILGTGLVGGIMRNNGRFTATEEMIAMGGGELFKVCDNTSRHTGITFPGHKHASLYDVSRIEGAVIIMLMKYGVKIHYNSRVGLAHMKNRKIITVTTNKEDTFEGDVFIDTTGTAGPIHNCVKYGNGCAMCIIRCPSFGGRISLTDAAGVKEIIGTKKDGSFGAMSGSCKLYKESLSDEIVQELNEKGVVMVAIPEHLCPQDTLSKKACQQYALQEYAANIILLDTGHAKLMSPYIPLDRLRSIPGFERARYADPYAGGLGNSMRYIGMAPRDNSLKVEGADNLFCAGEKAGLLVGHTEAICTGVLAGYNAVRYALGQQRMELPVETAVGDAIAYVKKEMQTEEGLTKKYTFSGSVYFERMKQRDLYTTDPQAIQQKIEKVGLLDVFNH
ncbi:FAD-dependent oxidoreductase [Petroclostridium sp. X23]|uniref:FAD-dependent oxidoreductase n=1 Tax=Petroclostridium sp. X23 TaxID=3045146 RepID=UPI0024AD6CAE|nr:FAD-dependent oxidoreductase [Petroclostridium sp. X23]WHH57456.1 FAD-dependent oxidoreductase [Petroclostridium sp. X23]